MNSEADQLRKRINRRYIWVIIISVVVLVAIITTLGILSIPGGGGG
jgi:uncharacterized membrane protein